MSAFCMTKSAAVWDIFRTIDMDVQVWYHACTYILRPICMYADKNYIKMCACLIIQSYHFMYGFVYGSLELTSFYGQA